MMTRCFGMHTESRIDESPVVEVQVRMLCNAQLHELCIISHGSGLECGLPVRADVLEHQDSKVCQVSRDANCL